jgi:hypothetical protein
VFLWFARWSSDGRGTTDFWRGAQPPAVGAEGIVLHSSDGRTFKVKPEISIDAAVIGYVRGTVVSNYRTRLSFRFIPACTFEIRPNSSNSSPEVRFACSSVVSFQR